MKAKNLTKTETIVNNQEVSNANEVPTTAKEILANLLKAESKEAQIEIAKNLIGFKIKVVPFNSITWLMGTITGIYDDGRVKKPMLSIKLDESKKKIVKSYESKLIELMEEKVDVKKPVEKLTDDEIFEMQAKAKANIGYYCQVDDKELLIVGTLFDKRSNSLMYTLKDAEGKASHKVYNAITLLDKKDEDLFAKNAKDREILTNPAKKAEFIQEQITKMESQLAVLNERIAEKQKMLEETKKLIVE